MENSELLIIGYKNITNEGIVLQFNKPFAMNGMLPSEEWFVSWDKIGKVLCGDQYCREMDIQKLREMRHG